VALGIGAVLDAVEQLRVAARAHLGVTEFALAAAFDLAAELRGHGLHAVADAQHRHAELEHDVGGLPFLGFIDRVGAAGKNDSLRLELADEVLADVEGMQFAIHLLLAHAAGNELRNLRTEVEDQDLLMGHVLYSVCDPGGRCMQTRNRGNPGFPRYPLPTVQSIW